MLVRGRLERAAGSHPDAPSNANIVAEYLEEVDFMLEVTPSRDFRWRERPWDYPPRPARSSQEACIFEGRLGERSPRTLCAM